MTNLAAMIETGWSEPYIISLIYIANVAGCRCFQQSGKWLEQFTQLHRKFWISSLYFTF